MEFIKDKRIVGYAHSAILDSRVCATCSALDKKVYKPVDMDSYPVPAHYMCRCVRIPVYARELEGKDKPYDTIPAMTKEPTGFIKLKKGE